MKNNKVLDAYKKGEKIIDSCQSYDHFIAANNYINNFFKLFCYPAPLKLGSAIFTVDNYISVLYENLKIRLKERKSSYEGY